MAIRRIKQINRAVKQRLCIDFDGVIYNNKYKDNRICMDNPPIDGLLISVSLLAAGLNY